MYEGVLRMRLQGQEEHGDANRDPLSRLRQEAQLTLMDRLMTIGHASDRATFVTEAVTEQIPAREQVETTFSEHLGRAMAEQPLRAPIPSQYPTLRIAGKAWVIRAVHGLANVHRDTHYPAVDSSIAPSGGVGL